MLSLQIAASSMIAEFLGMLCSADGGVMPNLQWTCCVTHCFRRRAVPLLLVRAKQVHSYLRVCVLRSFSEKAGWTQCCGIHKVKARTCCKHPAALMCLPGHYSLSLRRTTHINAQGSTRCRLLVPVMLQHETLLSPAHCAAKHFYAEHINYLLGALMLCTDSASFSWLQRMASPSTLMSRSTWRESCCSQMI